LVEAKNTWGWSLWSFAETGLYRGVAADGSPKEILASYYAPAFGIMGLTRCEVRNAPGDSADGKQG
jgi:hypothetical protein